MGRARLSRERIIDASIELVSSGSSDRLTMAGLGRQLGADPTAAYRHFRSKQELLRAVGDRILAGVTLDLHESSGGWRDVVTTLCLRLRAAQLAHPALAALVRSGPPMQQHEFTLTERLLRELRAGAGLPDAEAAMAYHALIELTVGSAALDAAMTSLSDEERDREYRSWRQAYAQLDERSHPHSVAIAAQLYSGDADTRFRYALDRLLDGVEATSRDAVLQ